MENIYKIVQRPNGKYVKIIELPNGKLQVKATSRKQFLLWMEGKK